MEQNSFPPEKDEFQRTTLLKVLLVLSFIGSSWSMFSGLGNALSQPSEERLESIIEILDQVNDGKEETELILSQMTDYVSNINQNIVNYGAVQFMLYAISLIGIYLMYKNRRLGFTIYMTVQVLLLGVPIYFGGYNSISVMVSLFMGFITMIFFALYATQLKYMDA
jgi:hypothetical protein